MEISLLEAFMRVAAAGSLSIAALYTIINLKRGNLRPFPVWRYVSLVLVLAAVHRGIIGLLPPAPELSGFVLLWAQQVNHALFAVMGVAFLLLAAVGKRKRTGDR